MTPKEKAIELVDKNFLILSKRGEHHYTFDYAKQCALIAVNEIILVPKQLLYIIEFHRYKTLQEMDINNSFKFNEDFIIVEKMTALEYWNKVKIEIKEL